MRIKTCLALALAGAFSISAAMATTLTKMDLNAIAKAASVAVVGEVTGTTTKQTDAGLVTVVSVKITNSMWGSDAQTVQVSMPGGNARVGRFRVGEASAGNPILTKGEQAVFMLTRVSPSDDYNIVGFNQGLFQINKTLEGAKVTLPGVGAQLTLDAAMSEIRQARSNADSKRSDVMIRN